jgi:allantoinase
MTYDLRLDIARAVVGGTIRPATIGVLAGRIAAVVEFGTPLTSTRVESFGDDVVILPGLVDSHVHVNEPGHPDWEGFASATRAAAAGGVTTLVDMPLDSIPVTTSVAALQAKRELAAGQSAVDVAFWGGLVPGNLAELPALAEAGVAGFKCFLADSGTPEFAPVDIAELTWGMRVTGELGLPLLVHAESAARLASIPSPRGPRYADFLDSRPDAVEVDAVAAVIRAARQTGGRAHIVHVSSAAVLPLLTQARADGIAITAETCPHYLTLDADSVPDGQTEYACCPPIRSAANAELLWDGLADGTLDLIVSDHSPATAALKRTGDFGTAWGGISSLQVSLPVTWTALRARGFGLVDLVRWMCTGPAMLAGLTDRGRIESGASADFCVFDPDAAWVIDSEALLHRQPGTPYSGRSVLGVVRQTWLRGERLDLDAEPTGELIERRS